MLGKFPQHYRANRKTDRSTVLLNIPSPGNSPYSMGINGMTLLLSCPGCLYSPVKNIDAARITTEEQNTLVSSGETL